MEQNISASLDRADELLAELHAEYNKSLQQKHVSARAVQLTHEIVERLRSVLDRLARRYWTLHVAPSLAPEDQDRATVYFPITNDQQGFDSVLGRWRWKSVRGDHDKIYDTLQSMQPFRSSENRWLKILNELAVQGKHIDLVPQKRIEERRVTVSGNGGSVSWGPGVTFSGGVSIMGAPIDPRTQRIIPTPGITEKVEIWVSFNIEGYGVNALGFGEEAVRKTRKIAQELSDQFGLQ